MKEYRFIKLILLCYTLSFGVFLASVYDRMEMNKTFQGNLKSLNELSVKKTELLTLLKGDFKDSKSVAAHLEALIQKNPNPYLYENVVALSIEQAQLDEFYKNFMEQISKHYPESSSLAVSLLLLEKDIQKQRSLTIQNLNNLL